MCLRNKASCNFYTAHRQHQHVCPYQTGTLAHKNLNSGQGEELFPPTQVRCPFQHSDSPCVCLCHRWWTASIRRMRKAQRSRWRCWTVIPSAKWRRKSWTPSTRTSLTPIASKPPTWTWVRISLSWYETIIKVNGELLQIYSPVSQLMSDIFCICLCAWY